MKEHERPPAATEPARHANARENHGLLEIVEMLHRARSLRHAANLLDASGEFDAAFAGAPILQTHAAELALKALHWLEANEAPAKSHDLAKLHDMLPQAARARLKAALPEIPDPTCPHSPHPVRPALRAILAGHTQSNQEWRYTHEYRGLFFESGLFKAALDAIIATCEESLAGTLAEQPPAGAA